jgi:redox-sensing transcriptional repressor
MSEDKEELKTISTQALKRMPYYIQYLKELQKNGIEVVSALMIANNLDLKEIQVRKDFSSISTTKGKPRAGFNVDELISNMEEFLGYHNVDDAVLVGVGLMGKSLLSYRGFEKMGMNIVTAFDIATSVVGTEVNGKKILPAGKISEMCRRMNIHIGIITVPAEEAQIVCDQLVAGGVRGIWNFAPIHLSVPKNVLVQNENMAASLALLSKHLKEKISDTTL